MSRVPASLADRGLAPGFKSQGAYQDGDVGATCLEGGRGRDRVHHVLCTSVPRTTTAKTTPLSRTRIVDAGVALADADGINGVTMRAVGQALGTGAMSLYNHIRDKDELYALMVDEVVAGFRDPAPNEKPLVALRAVAVETKAALVAHPWAPPLWLSHMPGVHRVRCMEQQLELLADSGLSPDLAHNGFHAVQNHVLGYAMQEVSMSASGPTDALEDFVASIDATAFPRTAKHLVQHRDGHRSNSFELVLDLILDGLVRRERADRRHAHVR
jgi:AcrR family transcriptional regulator